MALRYSLVIVQADVVLIVGARLNWMFDFGSAQQFAADVKFIKVDVSKDIYFLCAWSHLLFLTLVDISRGRAR